MEDDLKILKVEYLSNHYLEYSQTLFYNSLKWRRPPMKDDLKILNVEYLSNHWLDLIKILNLS